ncbi:hypothetical protein [Hymenobacter negativus]|uniref:DUF3379 family protein n=1 Tax=Hymenobacter negativus TaxID=2795026 RepID=A0ABS3QFZ9_9BACT|nr:hypothetical protein [Hymenobacter negativus]MBO2009625.1 hypothetical protein [Hymenobacter negativus]
MSDSAARSNSDDAWDDLLGQLAAQPKVQPRPFFYTRVQARLAPEAPAASPPLVLGWLRRPAYAVLLGALVLMLSGDGSALRPAAGAVHYNANPR